MKRGQDDTTYFSTEFESTTCHKWCDDNDNGKLTFSAPAQRMCLIFDGTEAPPGPPRPSPIPPKKQLLSLYQLRNQPLQTGIRQLARREGAREGARSEGVREVERERGREGVMGKQKEKTNLEISHYKPASDN